MYKELKQETLATQQDYDNTKKHETMHAIYSQLGLGFELATTYLGQGLSKKDDPLAFGLYRLRDEIFARLAAGDSLRFMSKHLKS